MSERNKRAEAVKIYDTICEMFESEELKYTADPENMRLECSIRGDSLPVDITFHIREDKEVVQLISIIPFNVKEEKRLEMAMVITVVNDSLINGSFDYDFANGRINFRMALGYMGSDISVDALNYMFRASYYTVDEYSDKFLMFNKGITSFEQFLEGERNG